MPLTLSSQHPVDVLFIIDSHQQEDYRGVFPARPLLANPLDYIAKALKLKVATIPAFGEPGTKIKAQQIRSYHDTLKAQVAHYRPKVIVPLGKASLYAVEWLIPEVFQPLPAFHKVENIVFVSKYNGIKVVPTESIYSIESNYLMLRTMIENVLAGLKEPEELHATDYRFLATSDAVMDYFTTYPVADNHIGVDTETTGLNYLTDKLRTIQFSIADYTGVTIPKEALTNEQWQSLFKWLSKRGQFDLQNGKFDYKFLRHHVGVVLPDWNELAVAHQIVDEREGTHNLKFIAQSVLGEDKYVIDIDSFKQQTITDEASAYAARDADLTRRAILALSEATSTKAFQILKRAGNALAHAEYWGMAVDQAALDALLGRVDEQLEAYVRLFKGHGINPSSTADVRKFFDIEGTTNKKALAALDDEVADAILDYRSLLKTKKSYLYRIRSATAADGFFHSDYRLAGTETGRLSSGSGSVEVGYEWKPINIMNLPRPALAGYEFTSKSEEFKAEIRGLYVARPGYKLVGADFAAAEMRWAANLSGDPKMIEDMNSGFDTHAYFAIQALGLPVLIDESNPKAFSVEVKEKYNAQRQNTKSGVFARLYGASTGRLAATVGVDFQTALRLEKIMDNRWPTLANFFRDRQRQIKQSGKLTSYFGRNRTFPYSTGAFTSKTMAAMLREGQNGEVQGPASDYGLLALGNFDTKYRERGWNIWAFVHDAIYLEVPEQDEEEAVAALQWEMENALSLPATILAEVHSGNSWIEL